MPATKAKNLDKKLSKMNPDNKNFALQKESFVHLRSQEKIRKMDLGILSEETSFKHSFKRTATKVWMGLKFGGLVRKARSGNFVFVSCPNLFPLYLHLLQL